MSMNSPTRRVVAWAVALVALAAVLALVVGFMLSRTTGLESRSGTEETPSAAPAPTSSSEHLHDEADLPEVIADNPYDCKLHMTPEELEAFSKRLMEFEAIRLSSSETRLEQMIPYATEDFLKTQTDVGNDTVSAVTITLESPSPSGCYMDDPAEITAYVNPFVTITDAVTGEIQRQNQPLTTHHTQWIKVGGSWYVSQERF